MKDIDGLVGRSEHGPKCWAKMRSRNDANSYPDREPGSSVLQCAMVTKQTLESNSSSGSLLHHIYPNDLGF